MKRKLRQTMLAAVFSALFAFSAAGCSVQSLGVRVGDAPPPKPGPPPHAPAYGYRAKYSYRYYPSAQVYFDISRKVYFYLDGDSWKMSVSLPKRLRLRLGEYVTLQMDTDRPYTRYAEHRRKYPPGQLKMKKKKWLH